MKKAMIIGSGPAGVSAALYLKRSGKVDVTVISNGSGALAKAEKIENYYGIEPMSGAELEKRSIENAKQLGIQFIEGQVISLTFDENMKPIVGTNNGKYHADVILIATGASRKAPKIPGLYELEGKGVSYCAVCDAFFYRNKDVCVIGNGEYALHEAQTLAQTSGTVTILTNGIEPRFEKTDNILINTAKLSSINGTDCVTSVSFENGSSMAVSGVFVAIGVAGSTDLARKVGIELEGNKIKVNENMMTNIPGIFSAGDCTGGLLQVAKAVYEGAQAGLAMIKYL